MIYGFVGLGELGGALALRLIEAGLGVVVHDRRAEAARRHVAAGAAWASEVAALARAADHLVTCLPSPAASEAVLAEALPQLRPGACWIEISTLGRDDLLRLAARAAEAGVATLESPVTGGVHLARRGEVTALLGGDAELIARHDRLLSAMASRRFHVGPLGAAAVLKVITNMLAFVHLQACCEALMLARRSGLDLGQAWRAIAASSGTSFVHETEGQLILNGSYDIGFSMDLALKDMGLALGLGREAGVPLDLAALVHQTLLRGRAAYGGEAPSTRIAQLWEEVLGTDLRAEGFPARLG
jgi:3-hydroxyisobutyrate dehydrogenase